MLSTSCQMRDFDKAKRAAEIVFSWKWLVMNVQQDPYVLKGFKMMSPKRIRGVVGFMSLMPSQ
jgi:hypothetical protein